MSETVIREVTQGVWTFSRPFARLGIIPFGGRSTAIRLKDGGVWVLASTPLCVDTKAKLDELGPVQYIIGADTVHRLFLSEYKKAYPAAKVFGPVSALDGMADKDLKFDGAWGRDPPDTRYGFEDDIKHCYFSGFKNKDIAFFHEPSKTLVEADLLLNLPCTEQYSKSQSSGSSIFGNINPKSWIHPRMIYSLGTDKEAMKKDAKTVAGWDFDRIIPCHGDVIETGGKQAWRDVYKFFLD